MATSYSDISTNVDTGKGNINSSISDIKNISFAGVWSGSAYNNLSGALESVLSRMEKEKTNIETFSQAMTKLEKYKENKEKIAKLEEEIASIVIPTDDEKAAAEASSRKAALEREKQGLVDDNKTLRAEIESLLATITAISPEIRTITFDPNNYKDYMEYIEDLAELKSIYDTAGRLRMLGESDSLYNYYNVYDENGNLVMSGQDYVEGVIKDIQEKYSGREAAVNSAIAILSLAADKGIRLNYEHSGTDSDPYVRTSDVATGVDCNPFVSWCLDKGVPGGFQWRPVGNFTSIGKGYSYENWGNAKPGDVLCNGGHVTIILDNDPATGQFLIAEASGQVNGIRTKSVTYQTLRNNGYTCRDMTDIYNGTVDSNRWNDFYWVDKNTYVRDYI
ncbi:MAG: hypothetical protein ACI4XM_02105 [Candidatus Coprovivens sp.]